MPAVPKRSSSIAGLASASVRTLITAPSISWAGTRQQAWLGGVGLTTMVARIGSKLISNGGRALGVEQRPMLGRVELALVRNLTAVNRVRQQVVEAPAREGFAAALGAAR